MKSGLKRSGGLTGLVAGLEEVGGFCGWICEADVEILDRGADYWISKWELQSKLRLQILFSDHLMDGVGLTRDISPDILSSVADQAVGGDWVNVESVVIVLVTLLLDWFDVVWGLSFTNLRVVWRLGAIDLKALPQLLPPLAPTASPTSSHTRH